MTPLKLDGAAAHKLWGGRFGGDSAPELDALNRSIDVDLRLWPFDIQLSKAWAVALWHAGVLTLDESRALEHGLDAVAARLRAGARPFRRTRMCTRSSTACCTTRSATSPRSCTRAAAATIRSRPPRASGRWTPSPRSTPRSRTLQHVLVAHASDLHHARALMPSYTHLQRAQPVAAAHWLLSHFWPLDRDRRRLAAASRAAAALPLGSGAIAGCAYPISRVLLQETLGFARLSPNSIDAVSDRDFVADLLFAAAMLGVHLSRLAEDLVLFGTAEFGFVSSANASRPARA